MAASAAAPKVVKEPVALFAFARQFSKGGGAEAAPAGDGAPTASAAEPDETPPPADSIKGTTAELWKWWGQGGRKAPEGATAAFTCIADAFSGPPRDKSVFSQVGEDGIIETIFGCIEERDKYYVEFGTQNCSECTTRYLRTKGWTGLLMDGNNADPSINLHQEYMRSDNIVGLFEKYGVPRPTFDHLTADIDMNTLWVLRALLAAGYRPRSVAIEYNRNFANDQAYTVMDLPTESWQGSCYFGASALAYERLMKAFGYSLVAFDTLGVNVFFVANKELGAAAPHTMASVTRERGRGAFQALHARCQHMLWLHVEDAAGLAQAEYLRHFRPVILHQSGVGHVRYFREVDTPAALLVHRHRRHGGGAPEQDRRRRRGA